jgi:hypothetical protein
VTVGTGNSTCFLSPPALACKRQADRPRRVVGWGMIALKKPTADMAIVMLPAEKKVA